MRIGYGVTCLMVMATSAVAQPTGLAAVGSIAVEQAGRVWLAQDVRPLVSGERVRVQKLARDLESAMETLNAGGIEPFQDEAYRARWQDSVLRFRETLDRYPQIDDPDVKIAATKLSEFQNMVAFGTSEAAKQQANLGDVQARLASLEQLLRANPAPGWLPAPFDEADATGWVQRAADSKTTAQRSLTELEAIAAAAYLPVNPGTVQSGAAYDDQDVARLSRLAQDHIAKVDEAITTTLSHLKSGFDAQASELDYYRGLDPEDANDRMNAFLADDASERIYGALDRQMAFAQSVTAYQRAFGKEPTAPSLERVALIEQIRDNYAANRLVALGNSSMPSAQSEDAARLAIARAILAKPDYGFGEHGPIVLTTPEIVEREREVSRTDIKEVDISLSGDITFSGTETTWQYRWEEFKFATPIQSPSGDWHVWWITAKNFSSGWERTPIGQWVSGAATKGDLIPRENF